jgi:O-antigen biosynthesis protein
MTHSIEDLHVYLRSIRADERTSLSVLAELVRPGASVLDLGCGSGALGQFLAVNHGCIADGLTLSEAEAEHARPYYRHVHVSDLETCDLATLFAGHVYDYIVCADVLEHLRKPERVLDACRKLLSPTGQLLISVPNAAYCGLVAELMQGEFLYREEGLLDKTHLRFFTRRSLQRFLREHGWSVESLDVIQRELPDSEFKVRFDHLPPAVARHILGSPDALTYQFIGVARQSLCESSFEPLEAPMYPAKALFTSLLYLGDSEGYDEERKLTATGAMGEGRQTLTFTLPSAASDLPTVSRLRLDPADRPGFMHLHQLILRNGEGDILWRWAPSNGLPCPPGSEFSRQIVWQSWLPETQGALLMLLSGDDPWLQLAIPPDLLSAVTAQHSSAMLSVDIGWPMSADYLCLASQVLPVQSENEQLKEALRNAQVSLTSSAHKVESLTTQTAQLEKTLIEREQQATVRFLSLRQESNKLNAHRQVLIYEHQKLFSEFEQLAKYLRSIESSTVFRATRPLVHAKMQIDRLLDRGPVPQGNAQAYQPMPALIPPHPVDVIVPVYRGLADTKLCLESVLASTCETPYRLIVINDASPEPEVTAWLRNKAQGESRITLLENENNLGFVGTVNRGMALSGRNDVLLLNSDTEVANDWLDRIRKAAYSDARVGTVTPLSNNATICSYPHFCKDNELPEGYDTAKLDALCAATNPGVAVDVPTGVGFCMYIRRDALAQVGLFDVANFGKGYGEENDFCQRAHKANWRNLHLLDTFVLHTGGVSFGASKSPREQAAMEILRRLHPRYEADVMAFVQADPAKPYRTALDLARVRARQKPAVLAVLHDRAGGTLRHVRELAQLVQAQATTLVLTPMPGHTVQLSLADEKEAFALQFGLPAALDDLLHVLRTIGVCHVHYHHLLGHQAIIRDLPALLGVPYDFTAHDFYSYCARISLTGDNNRYSPEVAPGECACCQAQSTAPDGASMRQWRETHRDFLQRARLVLAPSQDTAARIAAFAPNANVRAVPHTDLTPPLPQVRTPSFDPGRRLKVVVIGALSAIKGADLLEAAAQLAAQQNAPVDFHLLGYGYRHLQTQPKAHLTVHGGYEESELPSLLQWLDADVAWFPAQWPETYSYTLSAAIQAGLAVVGPDLGAFRERLFGREWSWVAPWDQTPDQWLALFVQLREDHFLTGVPPQPVTTAKDTVSDYTHTSHVTATSWSYVTDYLTDSASMYSVDTKAVNSPVPLAFIRAHLPQATATQQARSRAVNVLARLRSLPLLRGVARRIPKHWQMRVKSWLLR